MFSQIIPDVQKTADLVQEISAASKEQNSGVGQVNQAIQQLDQAIQQHATIAEEMASTSEELTAQAEQLQLAVAFFKIQTENKPYPAQPANFQRPLKPIQVAPKPRSFKLALYHGTEDELDKFEQY